MRRRAFLAAAGFGAAAASSLPSPALAQGRIDWRMVTAWPKDLPGLATGADRLARRVGEMSGGRFVIRVHPSGDLVPALQGFDAVANGTAELSHGFASYHAAKSKAFSFFCGIPYGLTAEEHSAWLRLGGGQRLWEELCEPFGIRPILCGNAGAQMGGWYRKELRKTDDLKGLKIRMTGLGAQVMEALGAKTVLVAADEIVGALGAKTIEATDGLGPSADLALALHTAARFYYWPGVHEPSAAVELLASKAKLEALPADLRAILEAAAAAEADEMLAEMNFRAGPAIQVLTRQHGVQLRQMPREILIAQGEAAGRIMKDLSEDKDPMVRKIVLVYLSARRDLMAWTKLADQGFANARELKFSYP